MIRKKEEQAKESTYTCFTGSSIFCSLAACVTCIDGGFKEEEEEGRGGVEAADDFLCALAGWEVGGVPLPGRMEERGRTGELPLEGREELKRKSNVIKLTQTLHNTYKTNNIIDNAENMKYLSEELAGREVKGVTCTLDLLWGFFFIFLGFLPSVVKGKRSKEE